MRVAIGAAEIHSPKAEGDGSRASVSGGALSLVPSRESCVLQVNNLIRHICQQP